MEDYQDYYEEDTTDNPTMDDNYDEDKLNYVLEEMIAHCQKYHLPFLKNDKTYQLFANAVKK